MRPFTNRPAEIPLEEEFSPELIAEANAVRERIHRRAGLPPIGPSRHTGFVSQKAVAEPSPPQPGFVSKFAPEQPSTKEPGFVSQTIPPTRAETNRANAQHSTGPKTPTGKLASSRNSTKHGLASGQIIIPGEDPAAFEALQNDLLEEHQPINPTECLLVQELAQSYWLTQRALRLQNECFSVDGLDEKRLSLFLRYHTTHERAFYKALNSLVKLKKERCGFVSQAPPKPAEFARQNAKTGENWLRSAESAACAVDNSLSKPSPSNLGSFGKTPNLLPTPGFVW